MKRHKKMELLESLLNVQEYCLEQGDCYYCVLRNWCATSPCNWSSKDIKIMVKVMQNDNN